MIAASAVFSHESADQGILVFTRNRPVVMMIILITIFLLLLVVVVRTLIAKVAILPATVLTIHVLAVNLLEVAFILTGSSGSTTCIASDIASTIGTILLVDTCDRTPAPAALSLHCTVRKHVRLEDDGYI